MLAIRKQLQSHSEWIYTVAVVLLCAIRSVGLGAREASILMAVAMLLALIKIILTDYEKREIILGAVIFGLLIYAFFINGDKMLLMSMIVIWGAKGTNIEKILAICLFVRVPLIVARILLAITGVFPGDEQLLLKTNPYLGYSDWVVIKDYGFYHANYLYLALYSVGLLLFIWLDTQKYRNELKGLVVVSYTVLMYVGYRILLCRTGFYMWVILATMAAAVLVVNALVQRGKENRVFGIIISLIPFVIAISCLILAELRKQGWSFAERYDALFSGRFNIFSRDAGFYWMYPFGRAPYLKLDNGYFYAIYNSGWILMVILVLIMTKSLWNLYYIYSVLAVLAMIGTAGYMIGEATPLSIAWNPALLLMAYGIFPIDNLRSKLEC